MSRPDLASREASERDPRFVFSLGSTPASGPTSTPAHTAQPPSSAFDRSMPRRGWERSSLVPTARSSLMPSAPSPLPNPSSRPYIPANPYPVRSIGAPQEHVPAQGPAVSPIAVAAPASAVEEQEQAVAKPRAAGRPTFAPAEPPPQAQSATYISAWPQQGRTYSVPSEVGPGIRPLATPLSSFDLHSAYPVPSVPAQPPAPGARLSIQDERALAPFLKPRSKRRRHTEPVQSPPPAHPGQTTPSPSLSPPEPAPTATTTATKRKPKPPARANTRPGPVMIDGKKRYPCGSCNETFSTSGHAARHSRIHRGMSPEPLFRSSQPF